MDAVYGLNDQAGVVGDPFQDHLGSVLRSSTVECEWMLMLMMKLRATCQRESSLLNSKPRLSLPCMCLMQIQIQGWPSNMLLVRIMIIVTTLRGNGNRVPRN